MITPSFTVSQSAITPGSLTVTDTSQGTYDTITQRRVYVRDYTGTYLTGNGSTNYDQWDILDLTITLDILTEDIGAEITVQWLNVINVVVNELDNTFPLPEFNKQFLYYLVQLQGVTPGIVNDSNYNGNVGVFWTNIIAGINAVTYGNDIAACQNCFSRATYMRLHQNLYF